MYLILSLSCYIPTHLCVLDQRTLQHILFILYLYLYISTISTSYLEAHSNTYLSLIFTLGTSFSSQFLVPRRFNEVTFSPGNAPAGCRGHSIEVMFLFRPHFISTPSALPAVRNTDVSLRVQTKVQGLIIISCEKRELIGLGIDENQQKRGRQIVVRSIARGCIDK